MNNQTLTLLSGKGGSGKTVIALSMSKVLSEAGLNVLLIDCDMSTHGATYFFEAEMGTTHPLPISLFELMRSEHPREVIFKTKAGFSFIPSTVNPAEIQQENEPEEILIKRAFQHIRNLEKEFDAIIFDCQAGYSVIASTAVRNSQRNLIVLEPDAVSSAALRVLYLQIGSYLKTSNTWQVFNKLTEEERPVYEKVFGGTLFTNLPPVPFDWQVRAAFATSEIPSVTTRYSAFGLGVLRLMRVVFPQSAEQLAVLEKTTVGKWYDYLKHHLVQLERQKRLIRYQRIEAERAKRLWRTRLVFMVGTFVSLLGITLGTYQIFKPQFISNLFSDFSSEAMALVTMFISTIIAVSSSYWYYFSLKNVRIEKEQDIQQETLHEIEQEIKKYTTLLTTDPSIKEYEKSLIPLSEED